VDFANKRIRLWTKKRKGGKEFDLVPMTEDLHNALLRHRGKYGQYEYVFVVTDKDSPHYGQPYKSRQHWLRTWCKRAEVKPFSFHCVRHLTASILDEKGIPLTTIQAILRHKSATTTSRYLHSLRGAKVALDEVFTRKPGKIIPFEKNKKASTG
jgi:integrase